MENGHVLSPCLVLRSPSSHLCSPFPHSILCSHMPCPILHTDVHTYVIPHVQYAVISTLSSLQSIPCSVLSLCSKLTLHHLVLPSISPFLAIPVLHSVLYTPISLPRSPLPVFPPHPLCISHPIHTVYPHLRPTCSVHSVLHPVLRPLPSALLTSSPPFVLHTSHSAH